MKVTKEYCDICGKEVTNDINTYRIKFIKFIPLTLTKQEDFQTCNKCQKMVRKYIIERIIENANQN